MKMNKQILIRRLDKYEVEGSLFSVELLLKFLKATGIGGSKGAKERELKWKRKNDQKTEDLS